MADTCTLTGRFVELDGSPASGRIDLVPSTTVSNPADDTILPLRPLTVELDADGEFSVTVFSTVDASWDPDGWVLEVTERIAGAPKRTYQIELEAGVLQLADLAPVGDAATPTLLDAHNDDTTGVHGIDDTSALATTDDVDDEATVRAAADAAHASAVPAHAASAVSVDPSDLTVVTTDNVQAALAELDAGTGATGVLTVVAKSADESVTSSTTLQDDDELTVAVPAGTDVVGRVTILQRGSGAADFKVVLTGDGDVTGTFVAVGLIGTITTNGTGTLVHNNGLPPVSFGGTPQEFASGGNQTTFVITLEFEASGGVGGGNMAVQWAQIVSDASPVTVKKGSKIELLEVA